MAIPLWAKASTSDSYALKACKGTARSQENPNKTTQCPVVHGGTTIKLKTTKIVYEPLPHEDEDGQPLLILAKVTKIETQDASESKYGKEQLKFELTVLAPEELEDRKVTMWFNPIISSSDSKKKSKYRQFIEVARPGVIEQIEEDDEEFDSDDLLGAKVRILMAEPEEDKFQKVVTVYKAGAKKAAVVEDEEEETPKPKAKKPAPVEEEEEETPKPKAKKKPVVEEEEEEETPKPKAKKKPVVEEEEEEEDRPAPKTARKKLAYKR